MEADSIEDAPFPPPKIYLSSSLPGSSVPIRAPLTIDSDSEFCLSNNGQICSRTSSFNSTSSIDISSYGDEHTSVHEEEDNTFLAYTDEEFPTETCRVKDYPFTTPFVRYPDENYVKERSNFDESAIFRPVVKTECEESSSVADFRNKLGAPVAPLTSDCDSDIDSVEGHRWLDSGEIPADEIVQQVTMSPKVRIVSSDEGEDEVDKESLFEGMFSDDSINSIHELSAAMKDSVLAESIEDEEHKLDCSNVVDSQRIDAEVLSNSENEIKIETISDHTNEPKKSPSENEEETQVEILPITSIFLNLIRLLRLSDQHSNLGNNNFASKLTILAIGKTGVGKTATINSIFGENKATTHPFGSGTASVQEIVGNIDGVHLSILDTPGLRCSPYDRSYNLKILSNIKSFIQKHTPDFVLYVDRLDMYSQVLNDIHHIKLITTSLGSSVWRKCIIALTHAGSDDHEALDDHFVLQRCRFIQQQIVRFGGSDLGIGNLVWLVENHPGYKQVISLRNQLIANDDDNIMPFEPLSELFVECKKAYFRVDGYCVKFLGTNRWSLACRLYY